MTAQIGDKFTFRGSDYSIVAISTPIQFNPVNFGIIPMSIGTACWAGYWCEYDISEKGIILKNLYINAKDDNYPAINGVEAMGDEEGEFKYMGHHLYKDVQIPMKYTGKILVGKDFLREYYIHMGYQRAWAYQTLMEFIFEEGVLLDTVDHSQMAEKLREEMKKTGKRKPYTELDIPRFLKDSSSQDIIKDSFSLDIDVKAWWMKK